MTPEPRTSDLRAWRAFLEAHAAVVGVLERELDEARGLPLAWYDVMVQLSEAPDGRLRMQQLATRVLLSKSGLTRLCDRMEESGYVRRRPSSTDGRGVEAALTGAGRAALRRAAPVHLRGVEAHFTSLLSEPERATLTAIMTRIRDAARGKE